MSSVIKKIICDVKIKENKKFHSKQMGILNIEYLVPYIYARHYAGLVRTPLKKFLFKDSLGWTYNQKFLKQLQNSNQFSGYYNLGWKIITIVPDIMVEKNGLRLNVKTKHIKEKTFKKNKLVSIKFPKDRIFASKGYYVMISNNGPANLEKNIIRLYFNTDVTKIPHFVKSMTRLLSRTNFPLSMKTLIDPDDYLRRDSTVLYVHRENFDEIIESLSNYLICNDWQLSSQTPMFTKKIFDGVGIAEEPEEKTHNESFGINRSRILAEGLIIAYKKKIFDDDGIFEEVKKKILKYKLNFEKLHLNPNSVDFL